MVRMSKRPKKSFRDTMSPKMVRYMSAEVPLYHGNIGRKSGCSSETTSSNSLQDITPKESFRSTPHHIRKYAPKRPG